VADAAQPGDCEERLVGKPASPVLTRKMPSDGFDLAPQLRLGQRYKKSGIAEIAVVFRDFYPSTR
jgi:hypothetical protein